jgi:hypothetical protein
LKQSKIINILKLFSPDELKSFEKFIISPYFSPGRDVSGLFKLLKKYYPDFAGDELDRELVYSKLYPGKKFNEAKLKNLASALTALAEQFLVHDSLCSDFVASKFRFIEQLNERNENPLLLNTVNALEKQIEQKLFDSSDSFDSIGKVSFIKGKLFLKLDDFEKSVLSMIKYSEYFTAAFLIRFLIMLKERSIITEGYNKPFKSSLLDAVSENLDIDKLILKLEENDFKFSWLIRLYYYAYKSIYNLEDSYHYTKLKELFYDHINEFTEKEKGIIFNDFLSYNGRNFMRTYDPRYKVELYNIYNDILNQNPRFLYVGGFFDLIAYRNIFFLAFSLKKIEWLEHFVNTYTAFLKPEYRDNMMNFTKAHLCFDNKLFDEALEYLNKVPYDLFIYKIDIKSLMLRIFYELNMFDQAFSLVDTYRHFLADSREYADSNKLQYTNFINLVYKLLKAKFNQTGNEAAGIKAEIAKTDIIVCKKWLLRKAEELESP